MKMLTVEEIGTEIDKFTGTVIIAKGLNKAVFGIAAINMINTIEICARLDEIIALLQILRGKDEAK